MGDPYFGAAGQAPVCDFEPVKTGWDPIGVVVGPNKFIVGFFVGGVLNTGWLGSGHARPIHFLNETVSSALLWRRWCHKKTFRVLALPHKCY